ncbi:MAG: hypothetical protein NZ740_03655 [Kiritimatiellae bacterium]|nr:hypothetical protein [Kiritimatiellia bacterium]MDW8458184.1 hypothetical protein [Verrucomicrobiota bacterium]
MKHHPRTPPPIINYGRFRLDFPSRNRPLKDNLKFAAFVIVLVLLFSLLYQFQARWLRAQNERASIPDPRALLSVQP